MAAPPRTYPRIDSGDAPVPGARITLGHRLCTSRTPAADDLADLLAFYEREARRFRDDPAATRALLATEEPEPDPEEAALTTVASVLLNLDATLTRE